MKLRVFVALVCAVLFLSGCSADAVHLPEAEYALSFADEYFDHNGNHVKLMYPVIDGYADAAMEEKVNHAARNLAMDMYLRKGLMTEDDGGYTYTPTESAVTLLCDTFYSVYIGGTVSSDVSGGAEYFVFSLNCDLTTGTFLTAEDCITDYPALRKLFVRGKFEQDFGYNTLTEEMSTESLMEQYKHEYGIYPHIYFAEGKLGILVDTVPLLDGYAGFTVDIRKAKKYLDTDNAAVAKLCGVN